MDIRRQARLIDVELGDQRVVLSFLDANHRIVEVNINGRRYDEVSRTYVDDPAKRAFAERMSQHYLGQPLEKARAAIGQRHDVYCYEHYNLLYNREGEG